MRMGNTIGSSNFRGAANAAAISEEWCAKHAADRDRRVLRDDARKLLEAGV